MPYKSQAQRRFFHTDTAKEQGIDSETVKDFDQASKGKRLPGKVKVGASMRSLHALGRGGKHGRG